MTWLLWGLAALLGLIGISMLVAGWELLRREPDAQGMPPPTRVHSIDLNLGETTASGGLADSASPATDSDARRRALAKAIERMSEPPRPLSAQRGHGKGPWEDTRPRVNLPDAERTPPA